MVNMLDSKFNSNPYLLRHLCFSQLSYPEYPTMLWNKFIPYSCLYLSETIHLNEHSIPKELTLQQSCSFH